MSGESYSGVYKKACREAMRAELAKSAAWRREMAQKEREAIARGEMQARDAIWQGETR